MNGLVQFLSIELESIVRQCPQLNAWFLSNLNNEISCVASNINDHTHTYVVRCYYHHYDGLLIDCG